MFDRALGRANPGLERRRQLEGAIEADAKSVVQRSARHCHVIGGADVLLLHRSEVDSQGQHIRLGASAGLVNDSARVRSARALSTDCRATLRFFPPG